jgi:hypothetical protein
MAIPGNFSIRHSHRSHTSFVVLFLDWCPVLHYQTRSGHFIFNFFSKFVWNRGYVYAAMSVRSMSFTSSELDDSLANVTALEQVDEGLLGVF